MPESSHHHEVDVAIIGGGPAGLTAAVYLRRFLRSVVVFDAGGARAEFIPASHNCPGFPEGISGRDLLQRLRQHAKGYGAEIIQAGVERIHRNNRSFTVSTEFGAFDASRVILATGIVDKAPAIAGLRNAIATGSVRLCPVCDAYEAKGKRIGVAGPEQKALNEALFLRTYSSHVVMLANKPGDISEGTRTKARAAGIEVWDKVDDVVLGSPGLGVVMADGSRTRMLDVVYPAMGCDVRSELASNIGADCDDDGYILVGPHLETSVPGFYAIGDVARALNQIAVGFGHAALAATHIHNALRERSDSENGERRLR